MALNAKSRIDNICLQQTNLVCNFGRQGLSAFCMILAARASAFLKRFVKFESRQTLSADLSAFVCRFVCNFEGLGGGRSKARKALKGEGPRHGKTKKLCRQSLSKMQTKFCRQTLSRHVPPKCRQRLSKMQTRALNFCRNRRQIMQTCVRARARAFLHFKCLRA